MFFLNAVAHLIFLCSCLVAGYGSRVLCIFMCCAFFCFALLCHLIDDVLLQIALRPSLTLIYNSAEAMAVLLVIVVLGLVVKGL